jgi:hypothetical protein
MGAGASTVAHKVVADTPSSSYSTVRDSTASLKMSRGLHQRPRCWLVHWGGTLNTVTRAYTLQNRRVSPPKDCTTPE